MEINGLEHELVFDNGQAIIPLEFDGNGQLVHFKYKTDNGSRQKLVHIAKKNNGHRIQNIPLWLSLIPPLVAILLALIFKEVVVSLFVGIFSGAFIAGGLRLDGIFYIIQNFFSALTKYIINALNDSGHLSIIVFSLLIGGMVAIISKNGGMAGVVLSLSKYAKDARSSQFITWFLGIAIFFDDYANTLIVGNTMRPVTDKFKVSREKLAYIVDSTAAPVAAIAFITTWIGAELGYIDDGLNALGLSDEYTAYGVFLSALKYAFYPVLTLLFILFTIYQQKDFGPMYKAEHRARTTGQVSPAMTLAEDEPNMEDLSPVPNAPLKWYNAALPVLVVILMTIFGLLSTGFDALYKEIIAITGENLDNSWSIIWANLGLLMDADSSSAFTKLGKVIGSADSYIALLWASLSGVICAIALTIGGRIMNLFNTMHWMVSGFKTIIPAVMILTLAWALALTTEDLHTAEYLAASLSDHINPHLFPVIIFVFAALISFSTGSSWSTMAILYPIAIPISYGISQANGLDTTTTMELLYNVIATVLAASVLGDHCSPISDTTILSSLASDCNHIDHVKTQMPYALVVGLISIICVGLSAYIGSGFLICCILTLIGAVVLWFIVSYFGKKVED